MDKLPETAAVRYVIEASDDALAKAESLPNSSIDAEFYDLEAGLHVPPDRVWSAWLCGDHPVSERREALRQFANGIDAAGACAPPVHALSLVRAVRGAGGPVGGAAGCRAR